MRGGGGGGEAWREGAEEEAGGRGRRDRSSGEESVCRGCGGEHGREGLNSGAIYGGQSAEVIDE